MTQATNTLRDQCSIARAASMMGDGWTLLILREIFWGHTRYEQIAQHTGMASNILADRLRKLVDNGIVTKTVVPEDARRFDYALTNKGKDLFPVLMAVMAWGDKWASGDAGPLVEIKHRVCGKKTKPGSACSACGAKLLPQDVMTAFATAYKKRMAKAESPS
jgi:DNA-binding HxlR family transcriptional regulator